MYHAAVFRRIGCRETADFAPLSSAVALCSLYVVRQGSSNLVSKWFRARVIGGAGVASLLVTTSLAAPVSVEDQARPTTASSGPPPASPLAKFPPHAASCVQRYVDPQLLHDAEAAAPDPEKVITVITKRHGQSIEYLLKKCGFEITEQGGEQLGIILPSIVFKAWSEAQLNERYSISASQLSSFVSMVPRADLAIIGSIPAGQHPSAIQVEMLRPVLGQVISSLGLKDRDAQFLLSTYIISEARLAPFE